MLSTLQSGPEPCPGDLGRFSSRVPSYLGCNRLRLGNLSHDAHSWLQMAPLFFHSLLSVCSAELMCPHREKSGGEWEKREWSQPETHKDLLLLGQENNWLSSQQPPGHPGERGWGPRPLLLPEERRRVAPIPPGPTVPLNPAPSSFRKVAFFATFYTMFHL